MTHRVRRAAAAFCFVAAIVLTDCAQVRPCEGEFPAGCVKPLIDDPAAPACIRLAGGAQEAFRDPIVYLSRVPDRKRFAPRAGPMFENALSSDGQSIAENRPSAWRIDQGFVEPRTDPAGPLLGARELFLAGEEMFHSFMAAAPFDGGDNEISRRKWELESLLELYGACASRGIEPWNWAAACRTGEALVHFGDILAASPVPPSLTGDEAAAYRRVIVERKTRYHRAGEKAWAELLRKGTTTAPGEDRWIARGRDLLWSRLAKRFALVPEMSFPLVKGGAPEGGGRIASDATRLDSAPLGTTWSFRNP